MSHFSTLICLPADTELAKLEDVIGAVMERWNENREVEPYRDYEEGAPEDSTAIWAIRTNAKHHREGTGVKRYDPKFLGWASSRSNETPEEQRAKFAADAEVEATFPDVITWEFAARFTNEKYEYAPDHSEYLHVDDDGRAYTWSTLNPERKWDYWRIGGRWRDYFIATEWPDERLITSDRGWDSPTERKRWGCDGGPRGLLDFDAMRDTWSGKRVEAFDQWQVIVDKHGQPPVWRDLCGLVDLKELGIDEARRQYNAHPAIKAARDADIDSWNDSLEEMYGTTRDEFIRLARLEAVPGYALVTLDGEWMAPGRMGWFGMSSDEAGDREAYRIEANRYLEALDPGVFVVALDLHI